MWLSIVVVVLVVRVCETTVMDGRDGKKGRWANSGRPLGLFEVVSQKKKLTEDEAESEE